MLAYLWVALGGALGSVGRYWLGGVITTRLGSGFPWGTLVVNVTGCLLIGIFAGLTALPFGRDASQNARAFLMVGICGGYTTFSSFALQTLELIQQGFWLRALLNTLGSVVLCLLAVIAGHALGAMWGGMRQ